MISEWIGWRSWFCVITQLDSPRLFCRDTWNEKSILHNLLFTIYSKRLRHILPHATALFLSRTITTHHYLKSISSVFLGCSDRTLKVKLKLKLKKRVPLDSYESHIYILLSSTWKFFEYSWTMSYILFILQVQLLGGVKIRHNGII